MVACIKQFLTDVQGQVYDFIVQVWQGQFYNAFDLIFTGGSGGMITLADQNNRISYPQCQVLGDPTPQGVARSEQTETESPGPAYRLGAFQAVTPLVEKETGTSCAPHLRTTSATRCLRLERQTKKKYPPPPAPSSLQALR